MRILQDSGANINAQDDVRYTSQVQGVAFKAECSTPKPSGASVLPEHTRGLRTVIFLWRLILNRLGRWVVDFIRVVSLHRVEDSEFIHFYIWF